MPNRTSPWPSPGPPTYLPTPWGTLTPTFNVTGLYGPNQQYARGFQQRRFFWPAVPQPFSPSLPAKVAAALPAISYDAQGRLIERRQNPPQPQGNNFAQAHPAAAQAGCYPGPCPPGTWQTYQHWPPVAPGATGEPICCPADVILCEDDYPPPFTYELALWPKYDPSGQLLPQQVDANNLCGKIKKPGQCPPGQFYTSQDRCWGENKGLENCFFNETSYGVSAGPCPPGSTQLATTPSSGIPVCCYPTPPAPIDPYLTLPPTPAPTPPAPFRGIRGSSPRRTARIVRKPVRGPSLSVACRWVSATWSSNPQPGQVRLFLQGTGTGPYTLSPYGTLDGKTVRLTSMQAGTVPGQWSFGPYRPGDPVAGTTSSGDPILPSSSFAYRACIAPVPTGAANK